MANKEGRIAATFREILYLKREAIDVGSGAPFVASDPGVYQIP